MVCRNEWEGRGEIRRAVRTLTVVAYSASGPRPVVVVQVEEARREAGLCRDPVQLLEGLIGDQVAPDGAVPPPLRGVGVDRHRALPA